MRLSAEDEGQEAHSELRTFNELWLSTFANGNIALKANTMALDQFVVEEVYHEQV